MASSAPTSPRTRNILGEYRLSGRSGRRYYRYTQWTGLLPLAAAGLLIAASRSTPASYWGVLGVTAGLHLILWGSYRLHYTEQRRTRLGTRLAARSDRWYPALSFLIHSAFVLLVGLSIWLAFVDLGYRATWWDHSLVGLLMFTVPLRRLFHYLANDLASARLHMLDDAFRCLNGIFATFLVANIVVWFLEPNFAEAWRFPLPIAVVWICAIVIVIINIIILVDRVANAGHGT